jgi:hypothetical protein
MGERDLETTRLEPAGYKALIVRFNLNVISNWHQSYVAAGNTHRIETAAGITEEVYPAKYWPGDTLGDHLEFAVKYDGTNLAILASIFAAASQDEFQAYIESKPRGKYTRRLWFLYEFLTGSLLPLDNLKQGGYIDLLETEKYFTASSPNRVKRQKINNNLLGTPSFCPIVRRTGTLQLFDQADLTERCRKIVAGYSPKLLKRAMNYLYIKETKSSFEIEHIKPNATRTERFVSLLQLAEKEDFCVKSKLIDLQNRIVDPRFKDVDYRTSQNYVGEAVSWQNEIVHFVSPKPDDLSDLMEGLVASHILMGKSSLSTVIHAAVVAYGFVFLHPFEDGNGRIHRFLIHNILASRGFTPEGIMFPVSAAMLKDLSAYDASLEAFSRSLIPLVEYSLDEEGQMTVLNDTARWYKYTDMTLQAEALFRFIEQTIDAELVKELAFLVNYDKAKQAIQEIVDMPDRQIDLFIRFSLQNNNRISVRKRASHFEFLDDEEIARMGQAIQAIYKKSGTPNNSD